MGRVAALRWAIAAAAGAGSLAGCHVPFISKAGSAGAASSTSVPASMNTCTIYAEHYDAEVILTPGRTSECGALITNLTGGGMVWSYTPNAGCRENRRIPYRSGKFEFDSFSSSLIAVTPGNVARSAIGASRRSAKTDLCEISAWRRTDEVDLEVGRAGSACH